MKFSHSMKTSILLLVSLFSCLLSVAYAEDGEESPGSLETFFAISAITGITETNLVNKEFERVNKTDNFVDLNIEIQLRWKGLFYENPGPSQENVNGLFSGDAIGYNFYNSKHWAYDVYFVNAFGEGEFRFGSPNETLLLPRDANFRLGLRATGYYSDYLAQFIITPISNEDEIGGVNASFSLRRTWLVKNWNLYATLGLNYQSDDIIDYYLGLSASESAEIKRVLDNPDAPFNPYSAGGGVFTVGEVGFEYPVSESFIFGGFISSVRRPSAATNSPLIVSGDTTSSAGVSLTYVF